VSVREVPQLAQFLIQTGYFEAISGLVLL